MSTRADTISQVARDLRERGYSIARSVFGSRDVAELSRECDRLKEEGLQYTRTFRHLNQLYMIDQDPSLGPNLRFVQWPAYTNDVLRKLRIDFRFLELLRPLIGDSLKQIANQVTWKTPGASGTTFALHQDCRFRRPRNAYRNLATSYVQTAVAIDPHSAENGCLRVYPGSHRLGDLKLNVDRGVLEGGFDVGTLVRRGLDPAKLVDVVLEPGDVALWTPFLIHGSGPNRSSIDRRFLINGYVRAEDCDLGEWAFRAGEPCDLGDPVPVQYEDLLTRTEPHYVDGAPHPYRDT